jgi:DNA-binding MarR family transcriptional regulator
MDFDIINSADTVALFCRLQMNSKRNIPIRPSEMGVLIFTEKERVPVTPLMISNFFRITKPTVTTMLNSLIKKGYLVKTPSATDGRSYTVAPTEMGKDLVESTFNEYSKTMELLKNGMGSSQFNLFMELMEKANNILSEEK